ncbi:uncharacterized protein LOC126836038 isoform X2 [Adelges cooleyi]|uniref:uncharacterized protein LOC126836038 isoform X2 n=1 Tax=Adelges cooleyi TaxID=133065 RepID=UPI00217F4343|nr:uncharacterized protein LOC126836038 isoform X2 [Adelges cooleyi]
MHLQKLISILIFWVGELFFTNVESTMRQAHMMELANTLNTLVRHSGWQAMRSVQVILNTNQHREIEEPMPIILEEILSGRNPIDKFNILERYKEIWTVLRCKFAEVLLQCRLLIQNVIRVCRLEKIIEKNKTTDASLQRYHICFKSLLSKLHSSSSRFKCMADALDFMYLLGPQSGLKQGIIDGTKKFTEYTSTVGPRTSTELSKLGYNENAVDIEIKNISDFFVNTYNRHIYWFANNRCNAPPQEEWSIYRIQIDMQNKKRNQQIPVETTLMQYVIDEMDSYVSNILDSCFFELGFAYDLTAL